MGVWALALISFFNIIGTYGSGWVGGFMRRKVLTVIYRFQSRRDLSLPLVAALTRLRLSFAAAMAFLALRAAHSGLVAQIFWCSLPIHAFRHRLFGHQVGSFFRVYLGGYLFDGTGSYDAVWIISISEFRCGCSTGH